MASGAGAAALACLNLLVAFGLRRENIFVTDIDGVVYEGRPTAMDRWKSVYARKTDKRTLAEVIGGADIFLGLVCRRRSQAGDGQADGGTAADPGAGQPGPGDRPCGSFGGAARTR